MTYRKPTSALNLMLALATLGGYSCCRQQAATHLQFFRIHTAYIA